eukprot:1332068-Amorphochlora_amoeboformis.AAC.2
MRKHIINIREYYRVPRQKGIWELIHRSSSIRPAVSTPRDSRRTNPGIQEEALSSSKPVKNL